MQILSNENTKKVSAGLVDFKFNDNQYTIILNKNDSFEIMIDFHQFNFNGLGAFYTTSLDGYKFFNECPSFIGYSVSLTNGPNHIQFDVTKLPVES